MNEVKLCEWMRKFAIAKYNTRTFIKLLENGNSYSSSNISSSSSNSSCNKSSNNIGSSDCNLNIIRVVMVSYVKESNSHLFVQIEHYWSMNKRGNNENCILYYSWIIDGFQYEVCQNMAEKLALIVS